MNGRLRQYSLSVLSVIVVAGACYPITEWIGYRTVSLLLLLTVSILAMLLSIGPVTLAAILSALIWDYFFIHPSFTLSVSSGEDALMLLMYFIVALLNGVLTNQIRQFERIDQTRKEKENALRLYNTLFNSLSHELRTPIATVLAASENLLSENQPWSKQDQIQMNREIYIAGKRLNRLVDNLLNVSRLESGHVVLRWDWCDIGELLDTSINRLSIEAKQPRTAVQIPEDIPLVRLDFVLMEQAIYNLLHNAYTYGGEGVHVLIEASYEANVLEIIISDNGKGFNSEDLNRIFEKFYRAPGVKAGGLGLGLSIVLGVIEAHHGIINVKNKAIGGAEITLRIPTGHLDHSNSIN